MRAVEDWMLTETQMGASVNKGATNPAILAGIRYHKRMYKLLSLHVAQHMPDWRLMVEPWFKAKVSQTLRSPDAVLLAPATLEGRREAIVVEVKKNWKDGRDTKLLDEYLGIVASALGVRTSPLMVVGNLRGLAHQPLLSMADITSVLTWKRGEPTPTLLRL